jgi:hypothetical protein
MTLMSNELVPGSNMYLEIGWVNEMPEPNPHIFEHSHDKSNEVVLHIGSNPSNPEDLGAEIEFVVGGEPGSEYAMDFLETVEGKEGMGVWLAKRGITFIAPTRVADGTFWLRRKRLVEGHTSWRADAHL